MSNLDPAVFKNDVSANSSQMVSEISQLNRVGELEAWLDDYNQKKGKTCWHHYGPANLEAYFDDPLRIIIISAESWGYDGCLSVNRGEYMRWIAKKDPTPRYASVVVCSIEQAIQTLSEGRELPEFDHSHYRNLYQNDEVILSRMERTGYLNARISSNATGSTRQDDAEVQKDIIEKLHPRLTDGCFLSKNQARKIRSYIFQARKILKQFPRKQKSNKS